MKIAVVGSEGYIGRALCSYLEQRNYNNIVRIDALVYGQRQPPWMRYARTTEEISAALDYEKPEAVVWLAAYAHDPAGFISAKEMAINNANVPWSTFLQTYNQAPWILASSLSVVSPHGAYPASKRGMEHNFVCTEGFSDRVDILRFGTIFGTWSDDQDVESFRPHLLLNSMVCGAVLDNKIRVSQPDTNRPVMALDNAIANIELKLDPNRPRGTISNYWTTCATLHLYAIWVQEVAKEFGLEPELDYGFVRVDPRDYGWGDPDPAYVKPRLYKLFRWVMRHKELIRKQRDKFPQNLYDYVESRRS